jgi:hypothetical protein
MEAEGESGGEAGQLSFSFLEAAGEEVEERHEPARGFAPEAGAGVVERNELMAGEVFTEEALEAMCREWLHELELPGAAKLVQVMWNARLKSTAGYASFPAWRIELNPRLMEYEGQVVRTLRAVGSARSAPGEALSAQAWRQRLERHYLAQVASNAIGMVH